jgi:Cd2+/Zn2+-exporting ATPase
VREAALKKEYILSGLCCPMCAEKMEKRIRKLDGVTEAAIEFTTARLAFALDSEDRLPGVLAASARIARQYEPGISLAEASEAVRGAKLVYLSRVGGRLRDIERLILAVPGVAGATAVAGTNTGAGAGAGTGANTGAGKGTGAGAVAVLIEAADETRLPVVLRKARETLQAECPGVAVSYSPPAGAAGKSGLRRRRLQAFAAIAGAALFAAGLAARPPRHYGLALFVAAYLLIGGEVLVRAAKGILKGGALDECFLMSAATIGAFAIGEYPEGVAVMLFYQIGEAFERFAVGRSRRSISALAGIRPDSATLKSAGRLYAVAPEEVAVGETIIVKPGESVPLDGVVVSGASAFDASALTGESLPRDASVGSEALSGFVNKNGLLAVKVTKTYGESAVAKILELTQSAAARKAPSASFIAKFSRYYTPAAVLGAIALAALPPLLAGGARAGWSDWSDWLGRALVFLVASCPCALVISVPLAFFGGIGGASRSGVLVKGGAYLEALANVDTVAFDKTGTLTKGVFSVERLLPSDGISEEALLEYAAYAESASTHPIAASIVGEYGKPIRQSRIGEAAEIAGAGIRASVDGKTVLAGSERLMRDSGVDFAAAGHVAGTVVHVAVDGKSAGYIIIADSPKRDSASAIAGLKALGVKKTAMLTGDGRANAEKAAAELGVDEVRAELLPEQKAEWLEAAKGGISGKGRVVFVGDGVNDAPALAASDVGVAMGGMGSDAAIEAADAVIMDDEPSKLVTAIRIAKKTRRIVAQNVALALGTKGIILILGALGIANMWAAVFGDVGVAVIAILNAMRAMRAMRAVRPGRPRP